MHTTTTALPETLANATVITLTLDTLAASGKAETAATQTSSTGRRAVLDQDALLLQHMVMVRFVARRIHERVPQHIELDDLISAGVLGLLDAAAKFDGSKQIQFASYAQFRVRGAILDSLRSLDWSPRDLRRKSRAIGDTLRVLTLQLGRTPSDAEIAECMGMDLASYQQLTGELSGLELGSLNAERSDEVGEEELAFLQAPATEDPFTQYLRGQDKQRLVVALGELPERERLVLTLYYFEEMTMREIGLTLGVVESRVSQIRAAALRQLRSSLTRSQRSRKAQQVSHEFRFSTGRS